MGWCHEFGVAVDAGCDATMHPAGNRCACEDCGAQCPGRFRGCERVWQRGTLPEATLAAVSLRRVRDRMTALGDDREGDWQRLDARRQELEQARSRVVAGPSSNGHGNGRAWVRPAKGTCPPGYPVKVKLASKLYHLPGMAAYDRTRPDRCYADGESAQADGFRRARR